MTLLDMIKKYESIKEKMQRMHAEDDEFTVDCILKDLRSVLADTSEITIHNMALEKIRHAILRNNFDDALKIAQMMHMLSN